MHAKEVLSGSEFDELKLTREQHIELYRLTVDWVIFALPLSRDLPLTTRGDRMESRRQVSLLAWKYKPERDRRWRQILSESQAKRWQQIQWQKQLIGGGFDYLQSLLKPFLDASNRRFRQTVKRIVETLTDAQQQRWQSMIGEPSTPLAAAHFDLSQD